MRDHIPLISGRGNTARLMTAKPVDEAPPSRPVPGLLIRDPRGRCGGRREIHRTSTRPQPEVAGRDAAIDDEGGEEAVQGRACDTPAVARGVSQSTLVRLRPTPEPYAAPRWRLLPFPHHGLEIMDTRSDGR